MPDNVEVVNIGGCYSCRACVVRANCVGADLLCKGSKMNDDEGEPYSLVNIRITRPRYDFYIIVG